MKRMMNQISQQQAEALATLTNSLRPEWDRVGILRVLEKQQTRADAASLSIAMLAAAQDPACKTPGVIGFDGKHWDRAMLPGSMKPVPPAAPAADTSPDCPKHPHLKQWECKACEVWHPKPGDFEQRVKQALDAVRAERDSAHV